MAYKDGILYAYVDENGKKIGIDNYEVARVIGVGSTDVGTLCTHPNVNKWSRDKPMHVDNHPTELTEGDKKAANYGLDTSVDSSKAIHTVFDAQKEYIPIIFDSSKTDEELKEGTVWRYEVPSLHTRTGRPAGAKFKEAGGFLSYYRLSDFDGYYHAAKPLVKVTKPFNFDNDGYYNITLEVSNDEHGLTFRNFNPFAHDDSTQEWNMNGWYLNIIVVSDHKFRQDQAAVYGVGATYGINTPFVLEENGQFVPLRELSISKNAISHLMGTWFVCVVITKEPLYYEMGEDSFKTGLMGENDIYIAYPNLQAGSIGDKCIFVEDAIMRIAFPDGAGTKLWEQKYLGEGSERFSYTYYYDDLLMSSITLGEYITSPSGDIRFGDTSDGTNRGFNIDLNTSNVDSIVRRKFRSIVFFNNTRNVNLYGFRDSNNYLTYDALNNTVHNGTYYKPLLKGVALLNISDGDYTRNTTDFYLKFASSGSTRYQQVIMRIDGEENIIFTTLNNPTMFIGQIEFQNVVNVRTNKPEGFRIKIRFGGTEQTSLVDERHPMNRFSPSNAVVGGSEFVLSTNADENRNTSYSGYTFEGANVCPFIQEEYSIDCHLPSDLISSQSGSGGGLYVLYDVTSDDYGN